jgi:hypothetical protein
LPPGQEKRSKKINRLPGIQLLIQFGKHEQEKLKVLEQLLTIEPGFAFSVPLTFRI